VFHKEVEYRYVDARINSGNCPSTSDRNLMSSRLVTPELSRLNCVQHASISTWISLTTFVIAWDTARHCVDLYSVSFRY